jgi:hypothetical protein
MPSADPPEEFCFHENAFFPTDQFIDDSKWGRVHNVTPRHSINGTNIDAPPRYTRGVLGDVEEFCYKENAFFPTDQFIDDSKWGRVHNVTPRHSINGTNIDAPPRSTRGVLGDDEEDNG